MIAPPPAPPRSVITAAVVFGLMVAAGWVASGCQRAAPGPGPDFTPVDASDAAIGDALPPGQCPALCAHLDAIGCHPRATCATTCDRGVALHLIDPVDVQCATRAPSAADVARCGGGFCR